jgi:hypothetical protein
VIVEVAVSLNNGAAGRMLLPCSDSLPVSTWRGEGPLTQVFRLALHRYPKAGCQGEPLPERKPCPRRADYDSWLGAADDISQARCSGGRIGETEALGACACEETP